MTDPGWRRYLRFWGRSAGDDLEDELRFHLEMREADYLAQGSSAAQARAEANQRLGDLSGVREACAVIGKRRERRMRSIERLETIRSDVVFALRQLARSPGFTSIALLTLALGIAANVTIFTVVDSVLLRPLPGIRAPERVVEVTSFTVSYPSYRDFREVAGPLESVAAFSSRSAGVRIGEVTHIERAAVVSGNYFTVLGAGAHRGRLLTDGDETSGEPVVVVSHRFWRGVLGGDDDVIGSAIRVNGSPATIVGIAAEVFGGTRLASVPSIWLPITAWPLMAPSNQRGFSVDERGWSWLTMVARLAPGATTEQAEAVLTASARRQLEQHPRETRSNTNMTVAPAAAAAVGFRAHEAISRFMLVLMAVVGLVLLVACSNVANLLLARSESRRREIAVRLAIGAGRGRLTRQLITEAMVLAFIAGGFALLVAWAASTLMARVTLPGGIELSSVRLAPDARVLGFALALATATALLFGVVPALQATRADLVSDLKDGARGASTGRSRLRSSLLVAQVAISLVLLVGAGLFVRGLQRALSTDLGFRTDGVALATVNPGLVQFDVERTLSFAETSLERVRALPGVRAAAWSVLVPLTPGSYSETASLDGYVPAPDEQVELNINVVSDGYLRTLGIPLLEGRDIAPNDRSGAEQVAVVNETLARRYWPEGGAVGRRIFSGGDTVRVIGVARTAKYERPDEQAVPLVYLPLAQRADWAVGSATLLARVDGNPSAALPAMQQEIRSIARDMPISELGTLDDALAATLAPQRFGAWLLSGFALLSLLVAMVGIYGVVAYGVTQRTREFGVRMALGAAPGSVVRLVVGQSLLRVLFGVVLGLALAAVLARVASGFLFGVSATDAITYAATALLLIVVAMLAAWLPARRATGVNPVTALRSE